MSWTRYISRRRWDAERARELSAHLEIETDQNISKGMQTDEARFAANRKLGNSVQIREEIYRMNSIGFLETMWQDIRQGFRMLRKNPGFTMLAAFTLALGIGANTAIFSVVYPLLIRPLPFREPGRLVALWETLLSKGVNHNEVAPANFDDWRKESDVFENVGEFSWWTANFSGTENPERLQGFIVSPSLFPALGEKAILGRWFLPEEELLGKDHVVILSYGFWKREFGGDPQIIGKSLTFNQVSRTVVGVMGPEFNYPPGAQLWAPDTVNPAEPLSRKSHYMYVIARLKPGVALERAQAELNTIAGRLEQQYPKTNKGWRVAVIPLNDDLNFKLRPALLLTLCAVGFLLLIACANVANLMLVRASSRVREMAIRTALGAGRKRVIRQLVTESVLLGIIGGTVGVLIALGLVAILPSLFPVEYLERIAGAERIGVDLRALGFTLGLSILTGIGAGLMPAIQTSKLNMTDTLKEEGTQTTASARKHRLRNMLVVAEVSLTLILLIGAGLMAKSFVRLIEVNPGFRTDHTLTMDLMLPRAKYKEDARVAEFYRNLMDRIRTVPGVEEAAAVNTLPLEGSNGTSGILIEGHPAPPPGQINEVNYRSATPDYFRTLGIPLLEGRGFTLEDSPKALPVAILNRETAQRFWPGEDPVGTQFRFDEAPNSPRITVIGIVGDVRNDLSGEIKPEIYLPHAQDFSRYMVLVVRTAGNPLTFASAIRSQVNSLDRDQAVGHIQSFEQMERKSLTSQSVSATLLLIFAAGAAFLSGVGIYGVISSAVKQRTREIGIHMALGAQPKDIFRIFVGQGLKLVMIGLAVGLIGATLLTRFMASLVFGVSTTDPATFAGVSLLLFAIAAFACFIPARRAMRVGPIVALRS